MNHSYSDARSCTQNTTSIAAMLHFATFMFWLERRPFSCQCTFFRTERGEQDAREAPPNNAHSKGKEVCPTLMSILKERLQVHACDGGACPCSRGLASFFTCLQGDATNPPTRCLQDGSSVDEKCIPPLHLFNKEEDISAETPSGDVALTCQAARHHGTHKVFNKTSKQHNSNTYK